jgi:hypothetical protein
MKKLILLVCLIGLIDFNINSGDTILNLNKGTLLP